VRIYVPVDEDGTVAWVDASKNKRELRKKLLAGDRGYNVYEVKLVSKKRIKQ